MWLKSAKGRRSAKAAEVEMVMAGCLGSAVVLEVLLAKVDAAQLVHVYMPSTASPATGEHTSVLLSDR